MHHLIPFLFCINSLVTGQLWMPFANLGSVIQTLKKHELFDPTYADTVPGTMSSMDYISSAAKSYIQNLTKILLGVGSNKFEETPITEITLKPVINEKFRTTTLPAWFRNVTSLSLTSASTKGDSDDRLLKKLTTIVSSTARRTTVSKRSTTAGESSTSSITTSTATPIKQTHISTTKQQMTTSTKHNLPLSPLMQTTHGVLIRPPVIFPSNIKTKVSRKKALKKFGSTTDLSSSFCEICKPGKSCTLRLRSFETSDQIFQYAYSHSTMLDEPLLSVFRETQGTILLPPLSWKASISPETVQLAQTLMRMQQPNRSLIVGIFTGLSLLAVAAQTDSRGIVIGLEYPEFIVYWEKIGMQHASKLKLMNRIQVRSLENVDKALQRIATTETGTFDFIILDDYRQVNYLNDYEHAVRLLRAGGILLIADAFNGGTVLSGPDYVTQEGKVVQKMNLRIKQDSRVSAVLLPFSGGTWLVTKL